MKITRLITAVALLLLVTLLPAKVLLRQNFDDTEFFQQGSFKAGQSSDGSTWRAMSATPEDFTIVTSPAASAPQALRIARLSSVGAGVFKTHIAEGYNYSVEFKCHLEAHNGVALHFRRQGLDTPMAGISLKAACHPYAYNTEMGWNEAKELPALPESQWFTCHIDFNVAEHNYKLAIVYPDGMAVSGEAEYPCRFSDIFDEVHFINVLPIGNHSVIDDLVIEQADSPALESRTCQNPRVSAATAGLDNLLAGGSGEYAAQPGTSAVIEFSPEAEIGALVLTAANDAPLPRVTVKVLNLLGHWITLGEKLAFDANGHLALPATQKVVKLTMDFEAPVTLTVAAIYSPFSAGQHTLDKAWSEKLDAEYRLPVYDMQYAGHDKAELTFVNHTNDVLKATVTLTERANNQDFGTREVEIQPGTSCIYYDVKELPNGEYLTAIEDNSNPSAKKRGTLLRLLRHRTSPPCAATPRKEMDGQKMFFPDGFFLEQYENIDFTPGVAERHLVVRGKPGDDEKFIVFGDKLFLDEDGNIRVNFHTYDRMWHTASIQHFNAIATDDTLDNWEVGSGSVPVPPQINVLNSSIPAPATPDWAPKKGPDGTITYHFYDPEKDGPVVLNQINCDMVSPAAQGVDGYQKYDWKIISPIACTIWPIWYKSPGEGILLTRTPLVDTFPSGGAPEPPNSGSDLYFGQWLEDDGKTFCMGHGRHLIRYMPYIARYDNLYDRARIVAVWRTRDGITWEQNYVAVPSDNKPIADQHYGGNNFRLPNAAGLRISILNRYDALNQQTSWELIYTWDGFRWTRFQDKPQFMPPGPLGDWYHSGCHSQQEAIEKDGKYYQLMTWAGDHVHFQSEITHGSYETAEGFTAEFMKQHFGPRHLEEWPAFQSEFGGSWEKLAEQTRNATSCIGLAVYRKDGFFSADAGEKTARMLTTPVSANGSLKMNAIINEDGFVEARLLQDGKPLPGFSSHLSPQDSTEIPVFSKLPDGDFQIELTLKNAHIYTLQF